MIKFFASLFLALVSCSFAVAQTTLTQTNQVGSLTFTNANVVDVRAGKLLRNRTVVVTGNRIVAAGKTGKVAIPKDARIVDAANKFLIPGLWDMHVHFWDAAAFYPIALANGITGLRDMGDDLDTLVRYRRRIESGELVAPRLFFGGQIVDGLRRDNVPFLFDYAGTPDEARAFVRRRQAAGADFVKVYSQLAPDVFAAVADEADQLGLPFAGHVPYTVGARAAAQRGQRSIEHLRGFAVAAAADEAARRQETELLLGEIGKIDGQRRTAMGAAAQELAKKSYDLAGKLYEINDEAAFDFYDERKGKQLIELFRQTKTWQTPTLAVIGGNAARENVAALQTERLKFFPNFVRGIILQDGAPTPEKLAQIKQRFDTKLRIVAAMHRRGVLLLAGSDAPNGNVYPGFSLHDELEFLVRAGLSPLDALRAATVRPAEFLGKSNDLGAVEPGKFADLVLLDADPLQDIRNTTRIRAVVADGRLLTRETLDKMLRDAEQKNQPPKAAPQTAPKTGAIAHEH